MMRKMILAALGIALILPTPLSLAAPLQQYGSYDQIITTAPANEVLQAGSVMPATLVTPMISDNLNAAVIAIVRQNVYDSVTGKNILIPAGSRLIGEPMGMNGKRIDLTFTRIIFPNGKSVLLPEFKSVDGIGYSGLRDKYTTHTWLKMRSILTGAIFAGAITASSHTSSGNSNDDDDNRSAGEEAVSGAISQILNGISNEVDKNNDIEPTGTVREGYQFNILLHTDIRIRPYEY